jgi:type I restriction enzyme S subunit
VRLKPSSVAWLGDVPQHWKVTRLKFEASEIVDCLHATPRYVEAGDHPAIRTADIEPGRVRLAKARKVDEDEYLRWTSRLAPKPGDILYSREGERYGIAALVPDGVALCISQRMMIFRIASRHSSAFIMWQLNSRQVYDQAAADQIGATAPHINVDRIKNYWLTLPPVDEQVAIARHIEARCRSLEASIERIEQESALIREYRVRLIADVVTGKLDVREAAEGLPDESESDPVDDVLAHVDVEGDIEEIVEGAGG